MNTLMKPQLQNLIAITNSCLNILSELHGYIKFINMRRADIVELRKLANLDDKNSREIGISRCDLVWAYSLQIEAGATNEFGKIA